MNEEKITVSLNEEDVQNLINCYEKDIKYIKHLENKIDKAIEYINKNSVYFAELHKHGNYFINVNADKLLDILKEAE